MAENQLKDDYNIISADLTADDTDSVLVQKAKEYADALENLQKLHAQKSDEGIHTQFQEDSNVDLNNSVGSFGAEARAGIINAAKNVEETKNKIAEYSKSE